MSEIEQWKPIVGYESNYEISNIGRVRRIRATHSAPAGYELRQQISWHGYPILKLNQCGFSRAHFVHRLVLSAFVGPCPKNFEANHINGIRHDNRLENLEWVSRSDNQKHRVHVLNKPPLPLPRSSKHHKAKLTEADIPVIRERAKTEIYRVIAADYGVTKDLIAKIVSGEIWKHVA